MRHCTQYRHIRDCERGNLSWLYIEPPRRDDPRDFDDDWFARMFVLHRRHPGLTMLQCKEIAVAGLRAEGSELRRVLATPGVMACTRQWHEYHLYDFVREGGAA